MKYLNKFSKFFKRKKKVSFDRVLINLQKLIDSVCPEEVEGIRINDVTINDNRHKSSLDFNGELGSIHIKLSEDKDTYILISLGYNHDMKFDMLTWNDLEICKKGFCREGSWMEKISHGVEGSLFDNVRNYLIENELIGPII